MAKAPHSILDGALLEHHFKTLAPILSQWQKSRTVAPVLLVAGQPGIGKQRIPSFLAQWLFCTEGGYQYPASTEALPVSLPCGSCPACRRIHSGNEVRLTLIQPDPDEEPTRSNQSLKIDQFRKLRSSMGFSAEEDSFRVIGIPNAERMTPQAANSILKLLEEPPRGWIFVLTCADPTLLLPTLVSRCQKVRLRPFAIPQIKELLVLAEVPMDRIDIAANLSQGSLDRALTFASDDLWKHREMLFEFFKYPASTAANLLDWAVEESSHFDFLLDLLEQTTADFIQWTVSTSATHSKESESARTFPWKQSDGKSAFMIHVQHILNTQGGLIGAREFWIKRAERLAQTREQSQAPLNRKLMLQDILFPWM